MFCSQADSTRKVAWVFYGLQKGEVVTVGDFAPKLAAFWVSDGRLDGAQDHGLRTLVSGGA